MIRELLANCRSAWSQLLTKLNAIGSLAIGFILAYPNAILDMRAFVPAGLQPFTPLLAVGWFCLVQYAKKRAVKHG